MQFWARHRLVQGVATVAFAVIVNCRIGKKVAVGSAELSSR